jgi:peptidoglycan/LPS O-acetylase OafA/YrhL
MGKLPALDGLRALAIGLVFVLHLSTGLRRAVPTLDSHGLVAQLAGAGGVGVALFFAISGLLVGLPLARNQPLSWPEYARRRAFRILPPYYLALLGALVGQLVLGWASGRELLPALLASALFVHNVVFGAWSRILPVAWSLEIEVQFYALAPLLGKLYKNIRAEWILGLGATVGATVSALANPWLARWHLDRSILSDGHFFLLGLALAGRFVRRGGTLARESYLWDVAGLLGLGGMLFLWGRPGPLAQLVALLGTCGLTLGALHGRLGPMLARLAAPVGVRCYSIYLVHYPLLFLLLKLTTRLPSPPSFGLALALQIALVGVPILLAAEVFHRVVELPCQKYGKKRKDN